MSTKISATSKHHPLRSRRRTIHIPFGAQRFLAAFEGIEGGFAIGASIVLALAFTELDRHLLLTTAIVSIIVNGFNNASIKYSSEHYLDELDGREKRNAIREYFYPALIEFVSYFAISFISIIPLVVIDQLEVAVLLCVVITLTTLFIAGYFRAYMLHAPRLRDALEVTLLGLGIIVIGLISGIAITIL